MGRAEGFPVRHQRPLLIEAKTGSGDFMTRNISNLLQQRKKQRHTTNLYKAPIFIHKIETIGKLSTVPIEHSYDSFFCEQEFKMPINVHIFGHF